MKTVAIAQARMGSTRVPGKVMRRMEGVPVLEWALGGIYGATGIDEIVLATSTNPEDDVIAEFANNNGIKLYRGSALDVLDRFYTCALRHQADVVLRFTCDCPFLDPNVISEVVKLREVTGAAYASNCYPPTYPDGLDTECFIFSALEAAWREATRLSDRDCLTQFIVRNQSRFPAANLTCPIPGLDKERWVLDTEADWKFCSAIAARIGPGSSYLEILDIIEKNPKLREINNAELGAGRNERFYEQIYTEPLPRRTFTRSHGAFERASERIPFGAQTFSKSHLAYPPGASPLYCSHGDGARIFDVDGNDYVDLVGALCPIILGYRDPDVNYSIRRQLDNGISFSIATEMESALAERLCRLIPCAEMVKFGKSGTDVTSAAVRVARAHTGRHHVLIGGYHGWADWSMAVSNYSAGIPPHGNLSHRLDNHLPPEGPTGHFGQPDKYAAIIIEPDRDPQYLKMLREFCTNHDIVLIFDEVITGFRYHLGGAQALYGITPDLACFGKAMANGMPISALVGRKDIMKKFEPPDQVFYSGTFFGEALSIAAALATIDKIEREQVIQKMWDRGGRLGHEINKLITKYNVGDKISINGVACRPTLDFTDNQIKTYFIREMIQNGVLILNANTLSHAHRDVEMKRVVSAYDTTLAGIAKGLYSGINEIIHAAPVRM